MTGYQAIKKQILPLLKGSPFIMGCFVITIIIAQRVIIYTPEKFSTMAKIKLDDQKVGISNNNLYADFDIFSTENKIAAEIEIIKSPVIVGAALDSLGLDYSLYRVGKIRSTLLYDNSPISLEHNISTNTLLDKKIALEIHMDSTYELTGDFGRVRERLGKQVHIGAEEIKVSLSALGDGLHLCGKYEVIFHSRDALIKLITKDLQVVDMDKGVAVLRVVYKDEHPVRAAILVNTICKAYINDYVAHRSDAADQTMQFISSEIDKITNKLKRSERRIEIYKDKNGIVNTRQQTETGLREISNLKLSLINLEMNEKAVVELEQYVSEGDYFDRTAINFGFGDLLLTELVKKLKLWNDEKLDLLMKYKPAHEKVLTVDAKIIEIKGYIKEAILRNKKDIQTKKREIEKSLAVISTQFDGLPTKEKDMTTLKRDFHLHEGVFNFLSQKKVEAAIASAATISFHRIIQLATPPRHPISPNKTLILFVSGLLSIFMSVGAIYLRQFISAKIVSREDIEKKSTLPVMGVMRRNGTKEDALTMAKTILLNHKKKKSIIICVSSTISGEGKTFVSDRLAEALNMLEMKTSVLSFSPENDTSIFPDHVSHHEAFSTQVLQQSIKGVKRFLKDVKRQYDIVILDAPASAMTIDSIQLMKAADLTLYISRSKFTSTAYAVQADLLIEEHKIEKIFHVINAVHKASNYSGNYVGRTFMPGQRKMVLGKIIKSYINLYFK